MTAGNVARKVKILPSNSKRHIGFKKQSCFVTSSSVVVALILMLAE
jgi:hypothetical protein